MDKQDGKTSQEEERKKERTWGHEQRQADTHFKHTKGWCVGWTLQGGFTIQECLLSTAPVYPCYTKSDSETEKEAWGVTTGKEILAEGGFCALCLWWKVNKRDKYLLRIFKTICDCEIYQAVEKTFIPSGKCSGFILNRSWTASKFWMCKDQNFNRRDQVS